ncbi:hypothetical protein ACFL6T_02975 [Candidatus Zixiibacteriota bacterium]
MNDEAILFNRWKRRKHHHGSTFIKDGIIQPHIWHSATVRPLFLLKEAYYWDDPHKRWNLAASIGEEKRATSQTKKRIALWAHIIFSATGNNYPAFSQTGPDDPDIVNALLGSAIVNIKKSHGQSKSDIDDIEFFARRDSDLLLQQIELYDPTIIVCGNVWPVCEDIIFSGAKRVYDLVMEWNGRWVIDFWHPANQFPNQLNYYAFMSLIQNGIHDSSIK